MECKYCNGLAFKVFEPLSLRIKSDVMSVVYNHNNGESFVGSFRIKVCPFCGRSLEKPVFDYYSSD